ncbi:MAG: hypothetical protein PHT02_00945 [Tissierellia bacterium]|nr:hypothetical protein [Tissierellia bacterium]
MKKNREVLENVLNDLFNAYNRNTDVTTEVKKKLVEHGINVGNATGILNTTIPIQTQSLAVLCLISMSLYETTKESKINPENYFLPEEIETANKLKREIELPKDYIEINNILQVADDQWVTVMSYQQIAELFADGKVRYNKETQRNTVYKEYNNKIIEAININKISVKEIKDLMLHGLFIPNMLTFNILATGEEKFEINDRNKSIKVYSDLDSIDGFHRNLSLIESIVENSKIKANFIVNITNFNVDKCHRFIVQEDKRNKIDKKYIQTINVESLENKIVKTLNERSDSELMGKITTNITFYKNQGYVLGNVLADAIKYNFEIKSMRDVNNVTDFLIEGFVEIIGKFIDDFKNLEISRKENVKTYSSTFIGYVTLLAELREDKDWKVKLEQTLNQINFSNNNPVWGKLEICESSPSKYKFKRIIKYFKDLVEEGVN